MSKAPHVQTFTLPNGRQITAVVMDEADFNELVDSLAGVIQINSGKRAGDTAIEQIKKAKHIPMMGRGTKTGFVFEKFGIETDLASFIVRGEGLRVALENLPNLRQR